MLRFNEVCFSYGKTVALNKVSFQLEPGVVGLLGPNGAGKTTVMRILAGVLEPDDGEVTPANRFVGYLPQRFDLMPWATVQRNVRYAAWAQGLDGQAAELATEKALDRVGLTKRVNSRARSLSGGMRQRLGLACATVAEPDLILLDEPTVGLDPQQRSSLRAVLKELAENSAVLIATHLIEDLITTSSRVLILNEGEIAFAGSIDELAALSNESPHLGATPAEAGYLHVLSEAK